MSYTLKDLYSMEEKDLIHLAREKNTDEKTLINLSTLAHPAVDTYLIKREHLPFGVLQQYVLRSHGGAIAMCLKVRNISHEEKKTLIETVTSQKVAVSFLKYGKLREDLIDYMLANSFYSIEEHLVRREKLPLRWENTLVRSPHDSVRLLLSQRESLSYNTLVLLANDEDATIRYKTRKRKDLPTQVKEICFYLDLIRGDSTDPTMEYLKKRDSFREALRESCVLLRGGYV